MRTSLLISCTIASLSLTAFLLPNNNSILVVGGTSSGADLSSAELYFPWTDSFQATGAMSVARPGITGSAVGLEGRFLAAGGTNLASTELYGFGTVKTDQADYAPGSIVTITGSGWQPGETVTLTLVESPLIDTHAVMTAVADGNGHIFNNLFSPDDYDLNIRFYLTAVGNRSGLQAQNTFTDSKPNTVTLNPSSFTVLPGSTATYTVTVNFNGNGNSCTSPLSLTFTTPAPVGATPAFSPSSLTSIGGNASSTLTITTTNTGPMSGRTQPNTYPFTVTAGNGAGCQAGTATVNGTLAVAGSVTALSVSGYPSPTTAGPSQNFTVTALDANGNNALGYTGTVHFTSSDSQAVLPANYTFLAADKGTHTFSATLKTAGTQSITATDTVTGTITGTQNGISVNAAATAKLLVADYPSPVTAGTSNLFTVTATDAFGNLTGGYTGTVHFTSSDGAATLPPNYTFTTGNNKDNGTHTFTATLNTAGTQSITATDTGTTSINGMQSGITVNASTVATSMALAAPSPASVDFGSAGPVTFSATLTRTTGGAAVSGATVSFTVDGNVVGSASTNASGVATFFTYNPSALSVASHNVQASFTGTAISGTTYASSASGTQTLAVTTTGQTINFGALVVKTYGNAPFTVSATGGASGNPVTFTASPLGVCTSSGTNGNTIAITGAGTCTVTAHQAGNSNYNAATDVPQSFTVNPAPVTVTFTAADKFYDGTNTAAVSNCSIATGKVGSDDVTCSVVGGTFASSDASASAQTVSATATLGGAKASNYTVTNPVTTTAKINPAPVTVTFTAADKFYDGTNTAAVSNCVIASGKVGSDNLTCSVAGGTFASSNASASAQTVSATATLGGTMASNYTVTNPVTTTAKINPAPVTVTFTAADKFYDGTNTAAVSNCVIASGKVGSDSVTCSVAGGTFASSNASASAQTVSATATLGGTMASNYTVTNPVTTTAKINPATPTVTVIDPLLTYDGNPHSATATAKGVGGADVTGSFSFTYDGSNTAPTNARESYAVVATFTSSDGNYTDVSGNGVLTIKQAASTTTVTGGTFSYDGAAHAATVSVTGAGGLSLTPMAAYSGGCSAAPVHVADTPCTAGYTFAGDANHDGSSGSAIITITKVPSTTTVSGGGSFVFDGNAHAATVAVTGAGNLSLAPIPTYSCSSAPVHVADTPCTASYTFAGDGDHDGSSGSAIITITKAPSTTTVSGGGSFVFDGLAHAATVAVTGAGNLSLTPAPTYSCVPLRCTWRTHLARPVTPLRGDADHTGSSGSAIITITKAPSVTVVSGGGSFLFDGLAHAATVSVTGAGNLSLTPVPTYSCGSAPVHVADTPCTASYSFAGDPDHTGSSDNAIITITQAPSVTVVSGGGSFQFDGLAHGATVSVTGAGGLSLTPLPSYSCVTAPIHVAQTPCTASYSFAGDPDHTGSSDNAVITITQAPSVTTIGAGYTVIYNALPHGVTANVTGAGGLNQAVPVVYVPGSSTVPLNPGTYTATATFAGDADHLGSSAGPVTINITYGACNAGFGPGGVILPPINSDGTSVYNRKGGSTIPVKFTVCDAFGNPVSNPAAVFAGTGGSLTMLSQVRGTVTVVNEDITNDIPDVAFRWTGSQWTFNMATTNLNQGSTYTFQHQPRIRSAVHNFQGGSEIGGGRTRCRVRALQ